MLSQRYEILSYLFHQVPLLTCMILTSSITIFAGIEYWWSTRHIEHSQPQMRTQTSYNNTQSLQHNTFNGYSNDSQHNVLNSKQQQQQNANAKHYQNRHHTTTSTGSVTGARKTSAVRNVTTRSKRDDSPHHARDGSPCRENTGEGTRKMFYKYLFYALSSRLLLLPLQAYYYYYGSNNRISIDSNKDMNDESKTQSFSANDNSISTNDTRFYLENIGFFTSRTLPTIFFSSAFFVIVLFYIELTVTLSGRNTNQYNQLHHLSPSYSSQSTPLSCISCVKEALTNSVDKVLRHPELQSIFHNSLLYTYGAILFFTNILPLINIYTCEIIIWILLSTVYFLLLIVLCYLGPTLLSLLTSNSFRRYYQHNQQIHHQRDPSTTNFSSYYQYNNISEGNIAHIGAETNQIGRKKHQVGLTIRFIGMLVTCFVAILIKDLCCAWEVYYMRYINILTEESSPNMSDSLDRTMMDSLPDLTIRNTTTATFEDNFKNIQSSMIDLWESFSSFLVIDNDDDGYNNKSDRTFRSNWFNFFGMDCLQYICLELIPSFILLCMMHQSAKSSNTSQKDDDFSIQRKPGSNSVNNISSIMLESGGEENETSTGGGGVTTVSDQSLYNQSQQQQSQSLFSGFHIPWFDDSQQQNISMLQQQTNQRNGAASYQIRRSLSGNAAGTYGGSGTASKQYPSLNLGSIPPGTQGSSSASKGETNLLLDKRSVGGWYGTSGE